MATDRGARARDPGARRRRGAMVSARSRRADGGTSPARPDPPPAAEAGGAAAPLPASTTAWGPVSSSPVMYQRSLAGPDAPGSKRTVSVAEPPGDTDEPSSRRVVAANDPATGGLDFVIVTGLPPVLARVNEALAWSPTPTAPKSTAAGVISRCPGGVALADRPTSFSPAVVSSPISSENWPAAVGANDTDTSSESPGPSVSPGAGVPLAENGPDAEGSVTDCTVSGLAPRLENVTLPVSAPWPTDVPPKETTGGLACSSAFGLRPVPE